MKKTNRSKHSKELKVLSSRECRRLAKRAASMALAAAMAASTLCAPAMAAEEGGNEVAPSSTESSAFEVQVLMNNAGSGTEGGTKSGEQSGGDVGEQSGSNVSEQSGSNVSEQSGSNVSEQSGGDVSEQSGGNVSEQSGGNVGEQSGGDVGEQSGGDVGEQSGGDVGEEPGSEGGEGSKESGKTPDDHFGGLHQGEDGTTTVERPEQSGSVEVNIGEEPTEGSAPLVPAKPAEDESSDPEGGTESDGAGEGTEESGEGTEESGEGTGESGEGTEEAGEGTEEAGEDTGDAPADEPEQEEVNWDLFFDEATGNYRINFHLTEATQEELVTLDLSNALAALREYAKQTGNEANVFQPGDTRVFEIYITSDSGHTYKYLDGSFILETPDLEQMDDKGEITDTEGFDGQNLPEDYEGEETLELGKYSEPIKDLLLEIGVIDDWDAEHNGKSTISYAESRKLFNKIKENPNLNITEEDTLQTALEKYLVNYYSEKDGKEYTDFKTMMKESATAIEELYSSTQANKKLTVTSESFANNAVYNELAGGPSDNNSRYDALENLINEALGTDYHLRKGTSSTATSKALEALKNALQDEYPEWAELIPTTASERKITIPYLKIYDKINGAGSAYTQYLENLGYDPRDFEIPGEITGAYNSKNLKSPSFKIEEPMESSTIYDNFYNALATFIYGEEAVKDATGGLSGKVQVTEITSYNGVTDNDDGKVYDNCVPAYQTGNSELIEWIVEYYGWPEDTLVCYDDETGNYVFGFKNEDGNVITAANCGLEGKTTTWSQPEYNNDDWASGDNEATHDHTVADYMNYDSEAWQNANAYFEQLLSQGVSAKSAAVAAFMAFNLDGERTGNEYQNTEWSFYNSITLERVDGEFHLTKTDENEKPITSEETDFQLWYYDDTDGDNVYDEDIDKKYFYTEYTDDKGNKTVGFVECTDNTLSYTIQTTNGELNIDYDMLEDIVYYLQEVAAPEGYELDTTVYIICDNEEAYKKAKEFVKTDPNVTIDPDAGKDGDGFTYLGAIDSEKPLKVQIVNVSIPESIPEDPTPDPDPTPEEPPLILTPVPEEETPLAPAPEEEIVEEETPLVDAPVIDESLEEVIEELGEEEVPLASAPKTGDESGVFGLMAALSGMALAAMSFFDRKGRHARFGSQH